MVQLENVLHFEGFAITIAHTQSNPLNPSNYPHFDLLVLADKLPYVDTSNTPSIYDASLGR